jgi:NADH:ubiquinone oxidoreductase subunit B-like Fe-S oxidoreductase
VACWTKRNGVVGWTKRNNAVCWTMRYCVACWTEMVAGLLADVVRRTGLCFRFKPRLSAHT